MFINFSLEGKDQMMGSIFFCQQRDSAHVSTTKPAQKAVVCLATFTPPPPPPLIPVRGKTKREQQEKLEKIGIIATLPSHNNQTLTSYIQ